MIFTFSSGSLAEKLDKIRILDNLKFEIEKKLQQGITFSNELALALSIFPTTHVPTFFGIVEGCLCKAPMPNYQASGSNVGYSFAYFKENTNDVCYIVLDEDCQKIGFTDLQNPPSFLFELFSKLYCQPDKIEYQGQELDFATLKQQNNDHIEHIKYSS